MKLIQKLMDERFAKSAAAFMKVVCYLIIGFCILITILSFMGRQTFILHTKTGTFSHAIYAEENHDPDSRSMTVSMGDEIHVWTNANDRIDPAIQIGLSAMYAVHIVPMIFAFWFLSRVFFNIQQGRIFTEQNASYLLYYGLIQCTAAVIVPFLKLLICRLSSLLSDSQMSIATGKALFDMLFPGIAFMVAAYIIHYGVHLQDEADHTL